MSVVLSLTPLTVAQTIAETAAQGAPLISTASALPRLVRFSGTVKDMQGNPLTGVVGVTFAFYSEAAEGAALWLETQNVTADSNGHYTVLLGSTKLEGLPADLFTLEQARWVGVQVSGQEEQPRVLLVSAPYALKAGDAETIGGLPPSAFVLANDPRGAGSGGKDGGAAASAGVQSKASPRVNADVTGLGVVGYIPMWDSTSDIVDSVIFQKATAIGIGTVTPAATLDVNGKTDGRDTLTLFPKGTDPTLAINGTAFKIDQTGKVTFVATQTFPGVGTITGITTAAGSGLSGGGTKGTLALKVPAAGITNAMLADSKITLNANAAGGLTAPGAMTLGSTYTIGLKACAASQILEYSGTVWNCVAPTGTGTITGVTAGTDLTGGGAAGKVTLSVDTTKVPQLSAANTFTGNQTVNGSVTATSFVGDGSGLSNITATNASELAGLPASDYAQLGASNTFTATNSFSGAAFGPILSVSNTDGTVSASAISASNSGQYGIGIYAGAAANGWGIEGFGTQTAGSIGVLGALANASGFSNSFFSLESDDGLNSGMWADGSDGQESALIATADDLSAGIFFNDSSVSSTIVVLNNGGGPTGNVARGFGTVLRAEGSGGVCGINQAGSIACTGQVKTLAATQNGARQVETYSVQSAENWLEDYGSGQLNHGVVTVNLDPVFADTVNTGVDFHVFLTPGGDCKGLYVTNKTAHSFEVHELGGGTTSIPFDYKIVAKRRGHETERLVDVTDRMQVEADAAHFKRMAKSLPRRTMPTNLSKAGTAKTGNGATLQSTGSTAVPKGTALPSPLLRSTGGHVVNP
jgi:hypothetical protein